jgi:hypothetical protein
VRGLVKRLREGTVLASRAVTGHRGSLPDALILGAQKAGTSSLFQYLMQHPRARPPLRKEVHFFDYNYGRGVDWYRRFFPSEGHDGLFTGEASPSYLFHPRVPARVADVLPGVAMVVLLRRPQDRAWSHYRHNVRKGRERRSLREALEWEIERIDDVERVLTGAEGFEAPREISQAHRHFSYLSRGLYVRQLERWWNLVGKERILVLTSEALFADPAGRYRDVVRFLGLADHTLDSFPVHNPGSPVDAPMSAEEKRFLDDYFAQPNRDLERVLSRSLDW